MTSKHHTFDGFSVKSSCNYHMFNHNGQDFLVIEQLESTTNSITNMIEHIVAEICHIEHLNSSKLNIIEYYPKTTLSSKYPIEIQGVKIIDGGPHWCSVNNETQRAIKGKISPGQIRNIQHFTNERENQ